MRIPNGIEVEFPVSVKNGRSRKSRKRAAPWHFASSRPVVRIEFPVKFPVPAAEPLPLGVQLPARGQPGTGIAALLDERVNACSSVCG
jgi:hypothetical protein